LVSISKSEIRSVEYEAYELSGVFRAPTPFGERDINVNDFCILNNGNIGIEIKQPTTGQYQYGDFIFLIEYLWNYPLSPPIVWLISPQNFPTVPLNLYTDGKIPYLGPIIWSRTYTSYDVGLMVRSWIYSCCKWFHTGEWDDTNDYYSYDQISTRQIQNIDTERIKIDDIEFITPNEYQQPSLWQKIKKFFASLVQYNGKVWEIVDVFVQAGLPSFTGPFYIVAQFVIDNVIKWIRKKITNKISPLAYPIIVS